MTGKDLYEVIEPHVDISFHAEYYADKQSLANLDNVDAIMKGLMESMNKLKKQTDNRQEYSAIELKERLRIILDSVEYYANDWRLYNETT